LLVNDNIYRISFATTQETITYILILSNNLNGSLSSSVFFSIDVQNVKFFSLSVLDISPVDLIDFRHHNDNNNNNNNDLLTYLLHAAVPFLRI